MFAVSVVWDVFTAEQPEVTGLTLEEIAAPMLALCVGILGIVGIASSTLDLKKQVYELAIWCIAFVSAYFWFASLRDPDIPLSHEQLLLVLFCSYLPFALIGVLVIATFVAINLIRSAFD